MATPAHVEHRSVKGTGTGHFQNVVLIASLLAIPPPHNRDYLFFILFLFIFFKEHLSEILPYVFISQLSYNAVITVLTNS
jgi:hypothetical protein